MRLFLPNLKDIVRKQNTCLLSFQIPNFNFFFHCYSWPAKITDIDPLGKISVFFYGTYETGVLRNDKSLWLFSPTTKERFGKVSNVDKPTNKLFLKGVQELEDKPEIGNGTIFKTKKKNSNFIH